MPGSTLMVPNASELETFYKNTLLNDVIPFWEKHSIDAEFGGYFSCLDRAGNVFDTDKFLWLQGRQVWMFSGASPGLATGQYPTNVSPLIYINDYPYCADLMANHIALADNDHFNVTRYTEAYA